MFESNASVEMTPKSPTLSPLSIDLPNDHNLMEGINAALSREGLDAGQIIPTVLRVEQPVLTSPIQYDGTRFSYDPAELDWPEQNRDHYAGLFDLGTVWPQMTEAFRANPDSKRLLWNFWRPEFITSDVAPSLISMQFLRQKEKLSMFVHMRSNRLREKFDLNYKMLSSVHQFAADSFGLPRGSYHHLVNAMEL